MESFTADRIVTINVDVQNDFCPGGSLAVREGNEVVAPLNELNEYTRAQDGTVVFTGDQHPQETPHFNTWPVHCVAGTEGAALHQDLQILPGDVLVDKGTGQTDGYSAFEGLTHEGQTLAELVTPVDRERVAVLIGGLATDYCVKQTALDAAQVDPQEGKIAVFVVQEAVRGVNLHPQDSAEALQEMAAAGVVIIDTVQDITNQGILKIAR